MVPFFVTNHSASVIFWAAYAIWLVPELIGVTRRADAGATKRDRGSRLVLYAAIFLGMTLGFSFAFSLKSLDMPEPRIIIFWSGIALMVFGTAFRWYAIRVLGRFFTQDVAVRPGQTVVQAGPYRYIRHPAYTGSLLTFLGIGFALGNWASLAAIMLCVIAAYSYRVYIEEHALAEALGQPYREYMRRTWRFVPFVL